MSNENVTILKEDGISREVEKNSYPYAHIWKEEKRHDRDI